MLNLLLLPEPVLYVPKSKFRSIRVEHFVGLCKQPEFTIAKAANDRQELVAALVLQEVEPTERLPHTHMPRR